MSHFDLHHTAPRASRQPTYLTTHDDTRTDNYYWLRERENETVLTHLRAENAYTDAVLAPLKDFREELFGEMKARIKEKDESVPVRDGAYWYYSRYEEG
ncbi:MAG: oligopeptidase B, partial [Bacteroidetes bacterium]|nr:oligopeptidase B [Bacteroidota bacterium]